MLIREHTHRYFFNPHHDKSTLESISWVNDAFSKGRDESLNCLLSVRDPIDSWLGLRHNFPEEQPTVFDEYCEKYLFFLDKVERTKRVHLFKYEDMISSPQEVLLKIGKFLGRLPVDLDFEKNSQVISSGNSGRQSSAIYARPRRPFTSRLVRAAKASKNYVELCERLNYPCLFDNLSSLDNRMMFKTYLNNILHVCTKNALKPFNQIARKFPMIRD